MLLGLFSPLESIILSPENTPRTSTHCGPTSRV
uniref:Uncharacterized protein n=1 Tax=Anguilla anguilla TaxID=7936 RepID=A0A0E9T2P3_ANGAN